MKSFDFDEDIQLVFNKNFKDIRIPNWKDWIKIKSQKEYLELALKLSGLDNIEDFSKRIKNEITDSKSFSVDIDNYINQFHSDDFLIFVHTSGTTNATLSGVKWFLMTKELIQRIWAPGMKAIFESSGLTSKKSAIIFVPSRINIDGIKKIDTKKYISLYSSEFSQRIMLAVINPESYLFYEYKDSRNLEIISKILSLNDIAVVSAPAATIMNWADLEKLKLGIHNSLKKLNNTDDPLLNKLITLINNSGLDEATKTIQKMLSDKLSKTIPIFSVSSLTTYQWKLIREFMQWDLGNERFTNLYVASEIGPFASSLANFKYSRQNKMYVFPLTIPVIERKRERELLIYSPNSYGKLLVSRIYDSSALINIDTGDIIKVEECDNIPLIGGNIYRASFRLKYPIKISQKIDIPQNFDVYAGDYFLLDEFDIFAPKIFLNCIIDVYDFKFDSLLLVNSRNNESHSWQLVLPQNEKIPKFTFDDLISKLSDCSNKDGILNAIKNKKIKINFINDKPIDYMATHTEILDKVHKGTIPKGILKKWPLYLVLPSSN